MYLALHLDDTATYRWNMAVQNIRQSHAVLEETGDDGQGATCRPCLSDILVIATTRPASSLQQKDHVSLLDSTRHESLYD